MLTFESPPVKIFWPMFNCDPEHGVVVPSSEKLMSEYISSLMRVMSWLLQKALMVSTSRLLKAWPVGLEGLFISIIRGLPPSLTALENADCRDASMYAVSLFACKVNYGNMASHL